MEHPLNIINERFISGYYDNLSPFTYNKDAACICYLLGYCSKTDYYVAKAKYEQINSNREYTRPLMIL